jgi:hydroxymethylglutaryl-CoA synthase
MLVTANPKVLEIGTVSGVFSEDIMDFWRPNDRRTPLFDGKYSTLRYLNAMLEAWRDYSAAGGHEYEAFSHFCYHLPFSRMGEKAHRHLAKSNKAPIDMAKAISGMAYNRVVGNSYTASIYLSILSTLENASEDLNGQLIGLFSYGSGATGEFFDAKVVEGYQEHLFIERHQDILNGREPVSYDEYVKLWNAPEVVDGNSGPMPEEARGRYRLASIDENKRIYIDGNA